MAKPVTRTHIVGTTVATSVALALKLVMMVAPGWQVLELSHPFTGENGTVKFGTFYTQLCVPADECKAQTIPETWDWTGLNHNVLKGDQLWMAYSTLLSMLSLCLLTVCLVLEVRALRTSSWSHSATGLVMMAFSTTACVQWNLSIQRIVRYIYSKMDYEDPRNEFTYSLNQIAYRITGATLPWNNILLGISAVITTVMALFFMSRFMAAYPAQTEDNELIIPDQLGDNEQVPDPLEQEQTASI